MNSLGTGEKNKLPIVEAEAVDYDGSPTGNFENVCKGTASLRNSEITPSVGLEAEVCFRACAYYRQHFVAVEEDPFSFKTQI